jgi:hypothetical protein
MTSFAVDDDTIMLSAFLCFFTILCPGGSGIGYSLHNYIVIMPDELETASWEKADLGK